MTIMRIAHTLRAAALVVAFAGTAHAATRWVVLDAQTYTCQDAREAAAASGMPFLSSPLALRDFVRTADDVNYQGTKVIRDGDGRVVTVVVTFTITNSATTNILFFADMSLCKKAAAALPSLSDLK